MWPLMAIFSAHQGAHVDIQVIEEQVALNPTRVELQYDLALAAWRAGDVERSRALVSANRASPDWPVDAVWLEAMLAKSMGQHHEAEILLLHHLQHPDARQSAYSELAETVRIQGRFREAGAHYRRAAQETLDPDDVIWSAKMAAKIGEYDVALRRLDWGLAFLGQAVSLREARVHILNDSGNSEAALRALDDLLELAPRHQGWTTLRLAIEAENKKVMR